MNDYSGNYDLNAVTSWPRWIGRVVSSVSWRDNIEASHFDPKDQKSWGYRYRVRYIGLHSANTDELPDEQLPMANVVLPVTAGSGLGGFIETPALSAGSVVTGFFMDGMAGQEPYIDGVLINSNNEVPRQQPKDADGGAQLFNDTYSGTNPQLASYVPDFLIGTKKIERPSFVSNEYKVVPSFPFTLEQLQQRYAARLALQTGEQNIPNNLEIINEIRKEQYIIENKTLPPNS